MEFQTITKQINAVETVFDDFDERPVDCDFVLPDYLPDIAAVLKCIMKPVVQTHQISGDRVMADGMVSLQILYLDEDRKCVRSFETSQPFTSSFTVKGLSSSNRVCLSAKVNYVNCRATSPRRVDIHGAFSVKLTVQGESDLSVIASAENSDLHAKTRNIAYSKCTAFAEKVFTVSEVLELENGDGAEVLVRTEAVPHITDCKRMPGKAVVKGEIVLKTVYATDTVAGTLGCSENTVLFSQIIDADGLDEEGLCSCAVSLLSCEAHPTQNPGGENKLLSFTAKLSVTLQAYQTDTCNVLTDVYHTRYPLKTESKRLTSERITNMVQDSTQIPLSVELPDGDIVSVVDLWCDIGAVCCRCEQGDTFADARLSICMITRDSRDCLSYYERPADFTLTFPDNCCCMTADIHILKTEYTLSGNRLEIHLTATVDRVCMESDSCLALCEISADENAPYTRSEDMSSCCMKVYFAGAGESLWEIAKAQHVSVEDLCSENNITDDILSEDTMLLMTLS